MGSFGIYFTLLTLKLLFSVKILDFLMCESEASDVFCFLDSGGCDTQKFCSWFACTGIEDWWQQEDSRWVVKRVCEQSETKRAFVSRVLLICVLKLTPDMSQLYLENLYWYGSDPGAGIETLFWLTKLDDEWKDNACWISFGQSKTEGCNKKRQKGMLGYATRLTELYRQKCGGNLYHSFCSFSPRFQGECKVRARI